MNAPVMPGSVTGMPVQGPGSPAGPPPVMPTVRPVARPGNMPGGAPVPSGMPQMQQPGGNSPKFIVEQQPNGTGLLRATNPDGTIGPVLKIINLPKVPGVGPAPGGGAPNPAVNMQGPPR